MHKSSHICYKVIARERVDSYLKEKKCNEIRCTPRDQLTVKRDVKGWGSGNIRYIYIYANILI
jgi:Asp/Glu/hydantoin racemase